MRPILFLDLDDVLCLNNPVGGFDVLEASQRPDEDLQPLLDKLFDEWAKAHLSNIHDEFQPIYVMGTSWTRFMDRELIERVMHGTGIGFVAENLHPDWQTQKKAHLNRAEQIRAWLNQHPDCADRWIAIDDDASGAGLQAHWCKDFAVLCKEDVGLTADKYLELRQAFLARQQQQESERCR